MARTVCVSDIEVAQARLLREQAKSASELRKALSVLLIAELGLDSDKAADILGTSKRTVFRNRRNICSQDGTSWKTWGGRRNCIMTMKRNENSCLNGLIQQQQDKFSLSRLYTLHW